MAFSFFYALLTPANIGGIAPVLNQPHGRREFRDRQVVACGRIGEATPLSIRRIVIVPTPGFGVAQYDDVIIVPLLPGKIHIPVNDQTLPASPCRAFIGGQPGTVPMKIELGNGIDLHFTGFSLIAREIKFSAAGQHILFTHAAGIVKKCQRTTNQYTAHAKKKFYFHFCAPLL